MVATVAAGTSAQYYLSMTDYYTGSGEPQGRWVKVGIDVAISVDSLVEKPDFECLHAGLDRIGQNLISNQGGKDERVGGYDVTFSAPKSVSVLWALSDAQTRERIEQAQAAAVKRALDILEENAGFCRLGKGGRIREKVKLTVATFDHGDARPAEHENGEVFSDPNLHTHAVVLNLGQKGDGRVGALDGKAIFAWKMAVGAAYHQALSRGLLDLGFSIGEIGKNGIFEVAGVDETLRRHFSARRQSIEDELEEVGLKSAEAPALAAAITRATRDSKGQRAGAERLKFWQEAATTLGFSPETVQAACLAQTQDTPLSPSELETIINGRLAAIPRDLTEHDSTFERRTLHAAVSSALVGLPVAPSRVDQELDRIIQSGSVLALDRDIWGHEVFTTPEILQIEREIVEMTTRLNKGRGKAPKAASVERLLSGSRLSDEQKRAVKAATAGHPITIIEGAPGSGKTTTLDPVKRAWEAAGYKVIGSATAWKIANMLRDDLTIDARATDSWLASEASGQPFLDGKTVLILDEAGLLSSRQMHAVLSAFEQAYHRGHTPRLIAVGDRNQLQSVGAGSGLRLLAAAIDVQEVEAIQRQRDPWAREAILQIGHGETEAALEAFESRGLLHLVEGGPRPTIAALVDAWEEAGRAEDYAGRLLIAQTNAQVRAISGEVRRRMRAHERLKGDDRMISAVTPSGQSVTLALAAGDRIRFLTRAKLATREVINGTEAIIEKISQNAREDLTIVARIGSERITFRPSDLADQHGRARLAHAYATTVYGAQGLTTDNAFVLLSPEMNRHAAYVAVSRARARCELFIDQKALDARAKMDLPLSERSSAEAFNAEDRFSFLAKQLSRNGLKQTSLDVIAAAQNAHVMEVVSPKPRARSRTPQRGLALD